MTRLSLQSENDSRNMDQRDASTSKNSQSLYNRNIFLLIHNITFSRHWENIVMRSK